LHLHDGGDIKHTARAAAGYLGYTEGLLPEWKEMVMMALENKATPVHGNDLPEMVKLRISCRVHCYTDDARGADGGADVRESGRSVSKRS
jgi:hypothetical protein